jgi:class 3 adenylate cyclase
MNRERVERRLAAILAADVAGYSRLMGADEEGTHERLQAHFTELVHPKIGSTEHLPTAPEATPNALPRNSPKPGGSPATIDINQRIGGCEPFPGGRHIAKTVDDKVAVFGNAGAGKSTLGRRLAELTGLPLYVVDKGLDFRHPPPIPPGTDGGLQTGDARVSGHPSEMGQEQ